MGSIISTANRHVKVACGSGGTQLVDDTSTDWGTGPDDHKAVQSWRDPLVVTAIGGAFGAVVTFDGNIQPEAADYSTSVVVKLRATTIAGTVVESSDGVLTWTPLSALPAGTFNVTVLHVKSDLGGDSVSMQAPFLFSFTVP